MTMASLLRRIGASRAAVVPALGLAGALLLGYGHHLSLAEASYAAPLPKPTPTVAASPIGATAPTSESRSRSS